MQSSDKLCLKWNDFQENLNSAFGVLRNDQDFADVTLACEDGTQIMAHKVVLASSSPFFMEILKKNKHSHPMIYMRGVKSDDLVAMVDFLYFKEANVKQEGLDAFLGLAEELKLLGVTGDCNKDEQATKPQTQPTEMKLGLSKSQPQTRNVQTPSLNDYTRNTTLDALVKVEADEMDEQIKSMMTHKVAGGQTSAAWACNVCGKEDVKKSNMKTHIEANHITSDASFSCDLCAKTSRYKTGLRIHKARQHLIK